MLEKSFFERWLFDLVTYSNDLFVEPEQLRNGVDLVDLVFQNAEKVQDQSIPAAQLPACSMGTDLRASTIVCRHATHHHFGSSFWFRIVCKMWYRGISIRYNTVFSQSMSIKTKEGKKLHCWLAGSLERRPDWATGIETSCKIKKRRQEMMWKCVICIDMWYVDHFKI